MYAILLMEIVAWYCCLSVFGDQASTDLGSSTYIDVGEVYHVLPCHNYTVDWCVKNILCVNFSWH